MIVNIDRPDIERAVRNIMVTIMEPLTIDQKLEVIDWMVEILQDIQDTVE